MAAIQGLFFTWVSRFKFRARNRKGRKKPIACTTNFFFSVIFLPLSAFLCLFSWIVLKRIVESHRLWLRKEAGKVIKVRGGSDHIIPLPPTGVTWRHFTRDLHWAWPFGTGRCPRLRDAASRLPSVNEEHFSAHPGSSLRFDGVRGPCFD